MKKILCLVACVLAGSSAAGAQELAREVRTFVLIPCMEVTTALELSTLNKQMEIDDFVAFAEWRVREHMGRVIDGTVGTVKGRTWKARAEEYEKTMYQCVQLAIRDFEDRKRAALK